MVLKILFLIAVDQITKSLASRDFLVKNYGLPFGIDLGKYNFTVLIIAGLLLTVYSVRSNFKAAFIFIFAGAISNLADRFFFGYVRDFISIKISSFNLADVFIILGLLMLIFDYDKKPKNSGN